MSAYSFEVKNIYKSFDKTHNVLRDVSFNVGNSGILCILGTNGAVKTTLIKCLLRLLEVDSGMILYQGVSTAKVPQKRFYNEIAAVLEGNRNAYWYLSGIQNLMYFGLQKGLNKKQILTKSDELFRLFDLYSARDEKVGNYSRGMQQKLSIIVSLLSSPKVLFLDEPTLGLDFATQKTVTSVLKNLSRQIVIVLTSHQLDLVDSLADRLLIITDNTIKYDDSPESFKQSFSSDKRTIVVNAEQLQLGVIPSYVTVIHDDTISRIIIRSDDNYYFNGLISKLIEDDIEIISISKDSSSMEDVLDNYTKIMNGDGHDDETHEGGSDKIRY